MKKTILVIAAFLLAIPAMKADVIIEGTHIGDSLLFGVLTVNCKDSHETCAIIRTGSSLTANVPALSDDWFDIDDYAVGYGDGGVQVRLYGVH
jgi:hypothetical protein